MIVNSKLVNSNLRNIVNSNLARDKKQNFIVEGTFVVNLNAYMFTLRCAGTSTDPCALTRFKKRRVRF